MLYDVKLKLENKYEQAADAGRYVLRVLPADLPGVQRVIAAGVDFDPPPAERAEGRDFFGARRIDLAYRHSVSRLSAVMRARVDRMAVEPGLDVSPGLDGLRRELRAVQGTAPDNPSHCLGPSPRIALAEEIAAWAEATAAGETSVLAVARAIASAIFEQFTFDSHATLVDTPAVEAFRLKRGVCQDFTHVAISALRSLGVPAGYVSGFLRTIPPEGQTRLEGADAMHAWVRVWCGSEMGWIEIDPTNDMAAGVDHIVIAYGRDYFDLAPLKGAFRASGAQTSTQSVDVVAV